MSNLVDRTSERDVSTDSSRAKFIKRYKANIKKQLRQNIRTKGIKDIKNNRSVTVEGDTLQEPSFTQDPKTGKRSYVRPGNTKYHKGHKINKQAIKRAKGKGQGGNEKQEEGNFKFKLTKEEFLEILFEDMELPNYIKNSIKNDCKEILKKAGISKDGTPSRLNVKKTFEQALARRIMTQAEREKNGNDTPPPFLDDVDLRYDYYKPKPEPVRHAAMFCLMDVSASMTALDKELAKRFYLLLCLFLEKNYDEVDLIFIRHTSSAEEVDEKEFFEGDVTGGTVVSSAFECMLDIIKDRYDLATTNIYVAQASDGDNFDYDNAHMLYLLEHKILPMVQYFAYVEIYGDFDHETLEALSYMPRKSLFGMYDPLTKQYRYFNKAMVADKTQVFKALEELFKDD